MFGIGIPELLLILVLALVLLGPQKLPEVAKSLGRGIRELRRASDDLRETFVDDYKNFLEDEKKVDGGAVIGSAEAAQAPPGTVATLDQLGSAGPGVTGLSGAPVAAGAVVVGAGAAVTPPGEVIDAVDPEDCGDAYEAARRDDEELLAQIPDGPPATPPPATPPVPPATPGTAGRSS